jgi:copper chaperone CopZ
MLMIREETLQVSGVRCERCVMRLARVLEGHEGLEAANANLMGVVSLAWDDERTSRDALLKELARGGFHVSSSEGSASLGFPGAG